MFVTVDVLIVASLHVHLTPELSDAVNLSSFSYYWISVSCLLPHCGFPSLLRSSVNLTFGRKRCSESVVASLPIFYCPAFHACSPLFTRYPGRIGSHTTKDTPSGVPLSNQRLPILPGRLQPSTFGVYELNYCVRDGNRWILIAIATESVRVCTLKTT